MRITASFNILPGGIQFAITEYGIKQVNAGDNCGCNMFLSEVLALPFGLAGGTSDQKQHLDERHLHVQKGSEESIGVRRNL